MHKSLSPELQAALKNKTLIFNSFMKEHFLHKKKEQKNKNLFAEKLYSSALYSLTKTGKRFRPLLALTVGELFDVPPRYLLAFSLALECYHVCSLIEDDLPCMDDSDFRRGLPANHKVYGEAISILVSNSLLLEAFQLTATYYTKTPQEVLEVIRLFSHTGGFQGTMSGQAMDLFYKDHAFTSFEDLKQLHHLKTGVSLGLSAEGSAILCQSTKEERKTLKSFGNLLGLAFQIKDDLLDKDMGERDNIVAFIGEKKALKTLEETHDQCLKALKTFSKKDRLKGFVTWNEVREV